MPKSSRRKDTDNSDDSDSDNSFKKSRSSHSSNRIDKSELLNSQKKKKIKSDVKKKSKHKKRKKRKRNTSDSSSSDEEASSSAAAQPVGGYTNSDNPFGDANLGQKFVWKKKKELESKAGLSSSERARLDRQKREESQAELAKLNERRAQRELELELREKEMLRLQREMDAASMGDWEKKEDEFHLSQAKKRAEIRIKENRSKPIDILALNMKLANDPEPDESGLEICPDEPYLIFHDLSLEEIEELYHDLRFYLDLEKNKEDRQFWKDMLIVCEEEMLKLRNAKRVSVGDDAVEKDIQKILEGKTLEQLDITKKEIEEKLTRGGPVDVDFWEALSKAVDIYMAKGRLKVMHQKMLEKRVEQLREFQRQSALKAQEEFNEAENISRGASVEPETNDKDQEIVEEAIEEEQEELEEYQACMSPVIIYHLGREEMELEVLDLQEDAQHWLELRESVTRKRFIPKRVTTAPKLPDEEESPRQGEEAQYYDLGGEETLYEDEDEFEFKGEATLGATTYLWQDKYRPRRPRYYNRVNTGYDWNKYNQTHYDVDNPPPKIVQGYKFNIFYPDLIDKKKAPTYKIEKDPQGGEDTVLLRFIAGPPYEDVAFRIVNRAWEYSHRDGFKCKFDRGVLQLHFHFKRHFYRK